MPHPPEVTREFCERSRTAFHLVCTHAVAMYRADAPAELKDAWSQAVIAAGERLIALQRELSEACAPWFAA